MKKLVLIISFISIVISSGNAQSVTDYTYKLNNGISVKTERCWSQVWLQQSFSPLTASDKTPLGVNIRTLGNLIAGSSYNLLNKGKEVKMQGAAPGTYDLKMTFKLSGTPGTLSFVASGVIIKPSMKTAVSVTLYDYQVYVMETPATLNGLSSYSTKIERFKGNAAQDLTHGVPSFYAKGNHDTAIAPDEATSETDGKIKPGTYDLLVSITISGVKQKVWLENFQMKPNVTYSVSINLNGGLITYTGGSRDVKAMHLYPAGTAAKQTGTPAPIKNIEINNYVTPALTNPCAPGTYDILLDYKNGAKYEWRKNVVVTTGSRTEVK